MKLRTLIKRLEKLEQKHGNVDVMLVSHSADNPCAIERTEAEVVEEGEFPKYFNMPAGLKYVALVS